MSAFIPWNSQPLEEWASKYAPGKFVDLGGHSTHYIEIGSGEPLILLHGFFFDTNMWKFNMEVLAERFKVYVVDLWGFGYSTRTPLDYSYPLYTRQLHEFMNAMNLNKASLMGQSMGGGTIINFTVANRDRVEKIVLVDPAGMPNQLPIMGRISNLSGVGELMYGLRTNFVRRFTLGSTFLYNSDILTDSFFEELTRFHKIQGSSNVMLKVTRNQFFDTLEAQIRQLSAMDVPTLIVWGREEKSIPLSVGEQLRSIYPRAQFEVLDEAGHCPNIDQPDKFNELAIEFLLRS